MASPQLARLRTLAIAAMLLGAAYFVLRDTGTPDRGVTIRVERDPSGDQPAGDSIAALDTSLNARESLPISVAVDADAPTVVDTQDDVYSRDFSGRVLDEQGQPVAGAAVRLLSYDNMRRAKSGVVQLPEPSSTTDAEGRFTVENRCEWSVTLKITKAGFETKLVGGDPQEGPREAPSYGDVVLRAGRELRGVVLGPDGERVAGARVIPVIGRSSPVYMRAFSSEVPLALAISDAAGEFSLPGVPVGPWAFIAQHARYLPGSAAGDMPMAPAAPGSLELRLGAAATVRGIVRGLPSDPPTLSLSARPVKAQDYTDGYGFDQDGQRHALRPDGSFEVTGLVPNTRVWIDLWTGDYSRFSSQRRSGRVTAEAGDHDVVIDYTEGFDVALQVVDSVSREGLEQLYVIVEFGEGSNDLVAPTNDEGVGAWPAGHVLALGIVPPRPGMPLRVHLHSRGYERFRTEVDSYPTSGLLNLGVFALVPEPAEQPEPPIVAEITVLQADGTPSADARLSFVLPSKRRDSLGSSPRERATTDLNGIALFRSSEVGLAAVSINRFHAVASRQPGVSAGGRRGTPNSGWTDVAFRSGQLARVTLTEAPRGALTVHVRSDGVPRKGVAVYLHNFDGALDNAARSSMSVEINGGTWPEVDEDGRFTFRSLATGHWTLAVRHASTASMLTFPIDVHAGHQDVTVPFDITEVSGRVVTPGGAPVAGALVQQGVSSRPLATALERFVNQQLDSSEETAVLRASRSLAWTTTDTNGGYTIRFALPGVDFVIDAAARGMTVGRSESFRTSGSVLTLGDIVIEPSGTLKIIQPDGVSSPTITIVPPALPSDEAFDGRRRMARFFDGVALIHGLSPGDWSVRWIHDDAETYDEALRFAVQIRAGEVTELNVTR